MTADLEILKDLINTELKFRLSNSQDKRAFFEQNLDNCFWKKTIEAADYDVIEESFSKHMDDSIYQLMSTVSNFVSNIDENSHKDNISYDEKYSSEKLLESLTNCRNLADNLLSLRSESASQFKDIKNLVNALQHINDNNGIIELRDFIASNKNGKIKVSFSDRDKTKSIYLESHYSNAESIEACVDLWTSYKVEDIEPEPTEYKQETTQKLVAYTREEKRIIKALGKNSYEYATGQEQYPTTKERGPLSMSDYGDLVPDITNIAFLEQIIEGAKQAKGDNNNNNALNDILAAFGHITDDITLTHQSYESFHREVFELGDKANKFVSNPIKPNAKSFLKKAIFFQKQFSHINMSTNVRLNLAETDDKLSLEKQLSQIGTELSDSIVTISDWTEHKGSAKWSIQNVAEDSGLEEGREVLDQLVKTARGR